MVKKNLLIADCIALAISWVAVAALAFVVQDALVTIVGVAAAYYLAKWIVLEKDTTLSFGDILAIAMGWGGAFAIVYFATKDALVAIVCIAAGYYLAKWIILKKEIT